MRNGRGELDEAIDEVPPGSLDPVTGSGSGAGAHRRALRKSAVNLTIEISGMCEERVVIERDNVTLIGSDPLADGITISATDPWVHRTLVKVVDPRGVRFENLTITGSESRGLEGVGAPSGTANLRPGGTSRVGRSTAEDAGPGDKRPEDLGVHGPGRRRPP